MALFRTGATSSLEFLNSREVFYAWGSTTVETITPNVAHSHGPVPNPTIAFVNVVDSTTLTLSSNWGGKFAVKGSVVTELSGTSNIDISAYDYLILIAGDANIATTITID